jgi:hypothetical protein
MMATPFDGLFGMMLASGKRRETDYMTGEYANRLSSTPANERGELLAKIAKAGGMDMASAVANVVSAGDKLELDKINRDANEAKVFAVKLRGIEDRGERLKFIKQKVKQRMSEGKPYDKLLELVNMDIEQQNGWALRNMTSGKIIDQLASRYLTPSQGAEYVKFKDLADGRVMGLNKATQQWEITPLPEGARLAPKQPLVDLSGLGKERSELSKIHAKHYDKLIDRGEKADSMLANLDQMDAFDIKTGAFEPAKAAFGAILEGFGVDASRLVDVDTAQSFEAVSNRLVNDVLNQAKGPQTEGDALRAKKTIAGLKDSQLAKDFKVASLRALALRTSEQRDFVVDRMDEGLTFSQASKKWRQFARKTPSLSSVVKDKETGLPMFFYQFKQKAQDLNPDASQEDIVSEWRRLNKK